MHAQVRKHVGYVVFSALLGLTPASPAGAVDGVREINQACVTVGCFPGDAPGFPVRIDADGSYRLTSNLQVPDENTTAIDVLADNVNIDLNGFAILGVTVCTGNPVSCAPVGSGDGITSLGSGIIRNGTIRGMGRSGIVSANGGVVERIIAVSNRFAGIEGLNLIVRNSQARRNGNSGISVSAGSTVINCQLSGNSRGIVSTGTTMVWENLVFANDGFGLDLHPESVYGNNVMRSNNQPPNPANQVNGGTQLGPNHCHGAPCP
jgi:hypothetical protein